MKRFNSILCVVDPEKNSETAIIQAMRIASEHQSDVKFFSVVEAEGFWHAAIFNREVGSKKFEELIEEKRSEIQNKISASTSIANPNVDVVSGIGFIEVIKSVIYHNHDLVVTCAEDANWLSRLFGSDDMHLLRKCPCPVLMLKPGQKDSFTNILATVDINESPTELDKEPVQGELNRQVLEYSATFCMPEMTALHIGSAWEAYAEDFYRYGAFSQLPEEKVDQYVEKVRRECSGKLDKLVRDMIDMLGEEAVKYIQPMTHLVKGSPFKEIPILVQKHKIDLVVMGTVGRTGVPGFIIGNTAESILEQVNCSVLAIKPVGFKSPVV